MENGRSANTIQAAVRQESATAKQSLMQRLFAVWFDAFVYNQIWEDPRVDLEALALDGSSRILTISSGGCNALNYLLEGPESITAVDLNQNHIHLLNLKRAAIKYLPSHDDFFELFGNGKGENTPRNYAEFIAPHLEPETRQFWNTNTLLGRLFTGMRIDYFRKGGLYEHSRNGYFLRLFHRLSKLIGCRPEEVLTASNAEDQRRLYAKFVEPFFASFIIRAVGKMPVTLFGLGIPPQQYAELKKDLGENGTIVDVYRERVKKLAVGYPIDENYFAWQAFGRKYDTENRVALPEYLKALNFDVLKQNIERVETSVGSVTEMIRRRQKGAFNRFVFLDAQDWMDAAAMTELWTLIHEKGDKDSRIIFRTAGANSPLAENLPAELLGRFEYHADDSKRLFEQDRASIYGGFHLYTRR